MTRREWTARATCPSCGWTGTMNHEYDPAYGTVAYCANPEELDGDVDDHGHAYAIFCVNRDDGFEVETEAELREAFGK